MLAADKLLLQSNLRQNAIKLKEKVGNPGSNSLLQESCGKSRSQCYSAVVGCGYFAGQRNAALSNLIFVARVCLYT